MSDEPSNHSSSQIDILEKQFYRIGEVSDLTGIKPHVLRYWESEFPVLAPPKSRAQQRLYRKQDIETVLLLKRLLYEEGYTIAGARTKLKAMPLAWHEEAEALQIDGVSTDEMKATLLHVRRELLAIRDMLEVSAGSQEQAPSRGNA